MEIFSRTIGLLFTSYVIIPSSIQGLDTASMPSENRDSKSCATTHLHETTKEVLKEGRKEIISYIHEDYIELEKAKLTQLGTNSEINIMGVTIQISSLRILFINHLI